VDAAICLIVLPKAFSSQSTGVWKSPTRRALTLPQGGDLQGQPSPEARFTG